MGSSEATFQAWLRERREPYHWLRPGNGALEHGLRTKTVLDLARLTDHGPNAPRLRLLDIGCGDARFVSDALPFAAAFGLDRSLRTLGSAARLARRGRFLAGGAAALPFTSESFDIVTLLDAVEDLPAREEPFAIREARRVLKPGGRMVISTTTRGGRRGGRRFTPRQFSRLFDDFTDVEIVGLIPYFPTLRMWMAAPIAWRLFRSRVRTCAPADARTVVGAGVKR